MFGIDDMLTGALSIGGGLLNNMFAGKRQEEAQAFNAQQAEINRQWQEKMSNTAYQRGMIDMKAAGLNPILAYQKGPASSPTGGMASTSAAPVHDVGLGAAGSSAMASMRLRQELENMKETNKNIAADTAVKQEQYFRTSAETYKTMAETRATNRREEILKENVQGAIADALEAKIRQGYLQSSAGGWLNLFSHGGRDVSKILAPAATAAGTALKSKWIMQDRWP